MRTEPPHLLAYRPKVFTVTKDLGEVSWSCCSPLPLLGWQLLPLITPQEQAQSALPLDTWVRVSSGPWAQPPDARQVEIQPEAPCLSSALGIPLCRTEHQGSLTELAGGGGIAPHTPPLSQGPMPACSRLPSGSGKGHRLFGSKATTAGTAAVQLLGLARLLGFLCSISFNQPPLYISFCSLSPTSSPFSTWGVHPDATSQAGFPSAAHSDQQLYLPPRPGGHGQIPQHGVKEKRARAQSNSAQSPSDQHRKLGSDHELDQISSCPQQNPPWKAASPCGYDKG